MKNNLKLLTCSALLLIFLLCVNSCGGKNPPVQETADSDDHNQTQQDTETREIATEYISWIVPEQFPSEFSAFSKDGIVIAEFGEPLISTDPSGEESLLTLVRNDSTGDYEFNVFPIKIHKRFDATAYSDESFFRADAMVYKDDGVMNIDRDQSRLNFVMDYNNKAEIMLEYDDIVLIASDFSKDIIVGEKYLFVTFMQVVDYHYVTYDFDGTEYEHEALFGLIPLSDKKTKRPNILPIKDGKLCLPDDFYQKRPYPYQKTFVRKMASITEEANEMLKKLGLTDNLFRDGMTIDELDEYFNLVTNKETFAPLFENAETQAP